MAHGSLRIVKGNHGLLMRVALACACLLCLAGTAEAQTGGGRVMRIIVPFASGGGQELLARTFYTELGAALGQSIIIENRPGAGGAVGSALVSKAAPDGQTLVIAATNHIVSALVAPKPPYDPIKDFSAVSHIGKGSGQVLLVNAKFPAKTVDEFVKYAKANPGKINYGTAGNGSSSHLAMAAFANVAGLQMLHVPYKSNAEPVIDMIGERIHTTFLPVTSAMAYANESRLRMIAITSSERWTLMPQLPTVAESFPGFEYQGWFGLLGPAGIPRPVVDRINGEMAKLLQNAVILERITKLGIEPRTLSPDAFARTMREDYERIAVIIKQSGVTAE